MTLEQYTQTLIPVIEKELQSAVSLTGGLGLEGLHHMLAYHLGWEGEGAGPEVRGKRIRPLLVLLTCASAGGNWEEALPAAAAVELVHNFSLIHDDVEDNSSQRRGRPTVWKEWGIAQAVNSGDALFSIAHLALLRLRETVSPDIVILATNILQNTCLQLTQGQYLDLAYSSREQLSVDDYWPMVNGKTAALLAASTELGALVAQPAETIRKTYREYGALLGLAFQVQDDLLGIWGDPGVTGKPAESDLVEGKKSLPVLYGLSQSGRFAARWKRGPITPKESAALAGLLEAEGGRAFTEKTAERLTEDALRTLEAAHPMGEAGEALKELTLKLLKRNK
jgi:geranylgeranyl diphosphate synthase type I